MSLTILCDITPDREAGGAEWLFTLHDGVAPGHRHIVHHPLVHVALVNTISEKFHCFPVCFFLCRVGLSAEHLGGRDILHETDLWQGGRESWWRKVLSNRQQSSHCMPTPSVSLQTPPAERELVHEVKGGGAEGKLLTCPRFSTGSLSDESSSTSQKSKLAEADGGERGEGGQTTHTCSPFTWNIRRVQWSLRSRVCSRARTLYSVAQQRRTAVNRATTANSHTPTLHVPLGTVFRTFSSQKLVGANPGK